MDKKQIVEFIKSQEGGFACIPGDPGKETNKGITIGTFRQVFGKGKTVDDLKRITDEQWVKVFDLLFWNACHCDEIEDGRVSAMIVDWAFNSGAKTAVKWAQAACNAVLPKMADKVDKLGRRVTAETLLCDGLMGRKTLAALNKVDGRAFVREYADLRRKFFLRIAGFGTGDAMMQTARKCPTNINVNLSRDVKRKFIKGWLSRVNKLEKLCL